MLLRDIYGECGCFATDIGKAHTEGLPQTQDFLQKCFAVKGDKGIEVAFAGNGFVGEKQYKGYKQACYEAPQVEYHRKGEQKNAYKLGAVGQLVVGLAEACYGYKCHIKYCFCRKPTNVDGELGQGYGTYDAHGARQAGGGVEGGKAQTVYGYLKNNKLPEDGDVVLGVGYDELKRLGDKGGVLLHKKPQGCYEDCCEKDKISGYLKIRACKGRKVVIVCLFCYIKDRGGQHKRRGGVVYKYYYVALDGVGGGGVGSLGVLYLWKGVIPFFRIYCLYKTLLIHGKRIYFYVIEPFCYGLQELFVHLVLHIAEGYIRLGLSADREGLDRKVCVSDSAAHQSNVADDRLYKAVLAAPHNLVVIGLGGFALGIGAGVGHYDGVKAVNQYGGNTRQDVMDYDGGV